MRLPMLRGCSAPSRSARIMAALVSPREADALISYMARLAGADADRSFFQESRVAADGERIVEVVGTNRLADPAVKGMVLVLVDATQHHRRADELTRRATTDGMTGLANRHVFDDRLGEAKRAGRTGALAIIDVDSFKKINDAHGHTAGDAALIEIGRRLSDVRPDDQVMTVARIGGDEFAILLLDGTVADLEHIVEAAQDSIAEPIQFGDVEISVTASAGLARLKRGEDAVSAADTALYAAKGTRSGARIVFSKKLAKQRRGAGAQIESLRRENVKLAIEARTDSLTKLPNRRRFDEDVKALDDARPPYFAVICIDLDHFGEFNKSTGGQKSGDKALKGAAKVFGSAIRAEDIAYRRGGEEFVVLLDGASLDEAFNIAKRIYFDLAAAQLPHPGRERVTASLGVAAADPDWQRSVGEVFNAADAALREAKDGGRDRIVVEGSGSGVVKG